MKKSYFLEGLTKRGIREGERGGKDCEGVDQGGGSGRGGVARRSRSREDTERVNNPVESLGVRQTLRPKGLYSGGEGVLPLKLMERKRRERGGKRGRKKKPSQRGIS